MSARQHRKARATAYAEAQRSSLWSKGEAEVKSKWYRRLLWTIWRPFRRVWLDRIARWYRLNLKRFAHDLATGIDARERDALAFRAASKRIAKARVKAKLKQRYPTCSVAKPDGEIESC